MGWGDDYLKKTGNSIESNWGDDYASYKVQKANTKPYEMTTGEKQALRDSAYNRQWGAFRNELYPALQTSLKAWTAQGNAEKDFDWESAIGNVLAQEKYLDVAKNFKRPSEEEETPAGYDLISEMLKANKVENPNLFTPQDLITEYKNLTYQPVPIDPDRAVSSPANAVTDKKAQERQRLETFNASDAVAEIKWLEQQKQQIKDSSKTMSTVRLPKSLSYGSGEVELTTTQRLPGSQNYGNMPDYNAQIAQIDAQIARKRQDIQEANRLKTLAGYDAVRSEKGYAAFDGAPDVQLKSAKNKNRYEYINDKNGKRNFYEFFNIAPGSGLQINPYEGYNFMRDDEKKLYNYILSSRGEDEAAKYLKALEPDLTSRFRANMDKEAERFSEIPGYSDVASIYAGYSKPQGELYALAQAVSGEQIDPNSPYFGPAVVQSAIRDAHSEDIKGAVKGFGGDALAFLYQTGMSIGDFVAMLPAGETGALALMGSNAATDTTRDIRERGGTNQEAVMGGLLAGAAEVVFERVSIESLINIANPLKRGAFILNVLRQAGVEASEEMLTEIANTISDGLVMGDRSKYAQDVQAYRQQGLSQDDAESRAAWNVAKNIGLAGLGGFLSGGATGTFAASMNNSPEAKAQAQQALLYEQAQEFAGIVQSVGLNESASQGVVQAYAQALQAGDTQAAAKLQSTTKTTAAKIAEVNAGVEIVQAEVLATLRPTFNAMQRAQQANDMKAFTAAIDKYNADFDVGVAKTKAAKLSAENAANAVRDAVVSEAETMQAQITASMQKQAEQSIMTKKGGVAGGETENQVFSRPRNNDRSFQASFPTGATPAEMDGIGRTIQGNVGGATADQYIQRDGGINSADVVQGSDRHSEETTRRALKGRGGVVNGGQERVQTDNITGLREKSRSISSVNARGNNASQMASSGRGGQGNVGELRSGNGEVAQGGLTYGGQEQQAALRAELRDVHTGSNSTSIARGAMASEMDGPGRGSRRNTEELRSGDGEAAQGARNRVTWGAEPTQEAHQVMQAHIQRASQNGKTPTVRFVRDIPPDLAKKFNRVMSIGGKNPTDVFLYESNDTYGDGFTLNGKIYVRMNGKQHPVYALAHEVAHNMPEINAVGLDVIEKLSDDVMPRYENYRRIHITSDDDADVDIQRELIADIFGGMMQEAYTGVRLNSNLGLSRDTVLSFHKAFLEALKEPGSALTENVQNATKLARGLVQTAEYSRIRLPDGNQFVKADRQVIRGNNPDVWSIQISNWFDSMVKRDGKLSLPTADGDIVTITTPASGQERTTSGKMSSYGGDHELFDEYGNLDKEAYGVKARAAIHADELLQTAKTKGLKIHGDRSYKHDALASKGWIYPEVYFMDHDGKYYQMKLSIGIGPDGKTAYNIGNIRQRKSPDINGSSLAGAPYDGGFLTNSIRQDAENSNKNPEYSRISLIQKAEKSTPWEADFPQVITSVKWNDEYKNDPDRLAGKKGDYEAAKRLANKYVTPQMAQEIKVKYSEALIVPIVDVETEGANKLPAAFAARLAELTGLTIEQSIDKINKTGHAQKDAIGRLLERAQFSGEVLTGQAYYLITDDFVSLGSTIADLRNYIMQNGGRVAGVATLGASNEASTILQPSPENIKRMEAIGRDELEGLLQEYGIANRLEDLTNSEAGIILRIADRIKGSQADILYGIGARFDKGSERANDERRRANQVTAPSNGAVFDSNKAQYSRVYVEDGQGNQVSHNMPDIKEKGGKFYAEFTLGGTRMRMEDADRATLEAEILNLKQEHDYRNESQTVKIIQQVSELVEQGKSVPQYYAEGGTNHEVAKLLRATNLRNGIAQGGALAESDLVKVNENVNRWKDHKQIWHTLSSPQRILEELANWRKLDQPGARAMNYLEGENLKNTYWGYIMDQGAKANLWMQEEAQKVAEAFDGNQRTSTLAQMLGEGIISEAEAGAALYDSNSMVVQNDKATFVFDKRGQLTAMSSGDRLLIYDKGYYDRVRKARDTVAKLAANRDPKVSHEDHLKAIREAEQNAMSGIRPTSTTGSIVIQRNGNSLKATANGHVLADIQNGQRADVNNVVKLSDTLKDFFARVFPQQNAALVENGHKPIPERKDYFPHMGRESNGLQDFLNTLHGEQEALPTSISGLTSTFTPGKPYVTHILQRMGNLTEYDAIRGFNKYIQSAADLIYYTPAIQRIRQLEKYIREESTGTQNSALASWLHNYANVLANKKPDLDRSLEDMVGRAVYTVSDRLTGAFGAASVAGNVSSALSNLIGFLSSIPGLEQKQIMPAIGATLRNGMGITRGEYDGFADKIPTLARRFGSYEAILETKWDRFKRKGSRVLGIMFQTLDRFSVESAARAKYAEFMGKGMTEAEAIRRTDDFLVKMFAERSKGMTPALFNMKSIKPIAQFQLEALNQLSHFRDFNRQDIAEQLDEIIRKNNGVIDGIDWAATENRINARTPRALWRKIYYLLLMSLWGTITRALMGRDQTWNPIGMAMDITTADKPLEEAWNTLVDQAPLLSTFTGGRVPIAGGLEGIINAAKDFGDPETPKGDAALEMMRSMLNFVPGGAQASKTIRGISANTKGGYYSDSGRLRYPIDKDQFWKTAIFGPSAAAPDGYDWQKDTLSAARTEKYGEMIKQGIDPQTAYGFLKSMDKSGTKAGAMVDIATYDGDGDGKPDFERENVKFMLTMMGYKPPSGTDIRQQAKKEAAAYISEKRKEKDLAPEKLKEAEDFYKNWMLKLMQ